MGRLVFVRHPCKNYWEYFLVLNLVCGCLLYIAFYTIDTSNNLTIPENLLDNFPNKFRSKRGDSNGTARTRILFWTPYFDAYEFRAFGIEEQSLRNCPTEFQCTLTFDKKLLSSSSAVLFHIRDLNKVGLPTERTPAQIWIFYMQESGSNTRLDLGPYGHVFNWTMTYRRDSDVHHPYGRVIPKQPTLKSIKTLRSRTGYSGKLNPALLVAWVVSNCFTHSNRESFVSELSKHIQVDTYGYCGDRSCPGYTSFECYAHLSKSYMFYLAFENSLCIDYVTEKFFDSLSHAMVPVVYGHANYSAFAPPSSFIDAREFSTPELLAKYLLHLSLNPLEYQKYFRWKEVFEVVPSAGWCDLCTKLRTNIVAKTYANISKWWNEAPTLNSNNGRSNNHSPACLPVPEYPNESWWSVFRKKYFILP